jgi:hypothetical protein
METPHFFLRSYYLVSSLPLTTLSFQRQPICSGSQEVELWLQLVELQGYVSYINADALYRTRS